MKVLTFAIPIMLVLSSPVRADAPKVAVFDFELADTSLDGEKNGPRADEQARLVSVSNQLRKGLADSGKFSVVDIAPVGDAAHNSNLQSCGGCDVDLAKKVDADLSITAVVHKISNLILSMNIYVHDTRTGQLVTTMSADYRGNTDKSWSRTVSFLLRNRLLAPNYGAPQ